MREDQLNKLVFDALKFYFDCGTWSTHEGHMLDMIIEGIDNKEVTEVNDLKNFVIDGQPV